MTTDKKTIDVEVCDIAVFRRTVSIPTTCPNPKCTADFTQEGTLKVWEYQDQGRHATVVLDPGGDGDSLDWPDKPEGGEGFIQISIECDVCGEQLAKGKEFDG